MEKHISVLQSETLRTPGVLGWNPYRHASAVHWCLRIMTTERCGKMIMFHVLVQQHLGMGNVPGAVLGTSEVRRWPVFKFNKSTIAIVSLPGTAVTLRIMK